MVAARTASSLTPPGRPSIISRRDGRRRLLLATKRSAETPETTEEEICSDVNSLFRLTRVGDHRTNVGRSDEHSCCLEGAGQNNRNTVRARLQTQTFTAGFVETEPEPLPSCQRFTMCLYPVVFVLLLQRDLSTSSPVPIRLNPSCLLRQLFPRAN